MKLGNLIISGIVTGSIYAAFGACVALWYRVCATSSTSRSATSRCSARSASTTSSAFHHWKLAPAIAAMLGSGGGRRRLPV